MNLKGKVALITGGARIGVTVAEELAKQGCHLAISYRSSREAAEEAAEKGKRWGVQAKIFKTDVTVEAQVKKLIQNIGTAFARLDVIVNMASVYLQIPFAKLNHKAWANILAANLTGSYLTVRYGAPLLKKNGGRVINFSDWTAASGRPRYKNFAPYFSAKMGVLGLTQIQALELAPQILVNAIAPGPILPPGNITKKEVTNVKKVTPLRKWGGALEIAKTVLFLTQTDYVTGECIRVDGGRHLF